MDRILKSKEEGAKMRKNNWHLKLAILLAMILAASMAYASIGKEPGINLTYRVDEGMTFHDVNESDLIFISQIRAASTPAILEEPGVIQDIVLVKQPNITETNGIFNFQALTSDVVWRGVSIVFQNSFAKVDFSRLINLRTKDAYNIDSNVKLNYNFVEINGTALPEFNVPSTINITGLTFSSVRILKDGQDCKDCTLLSYNNGDAYFSAPGFSFYQIATGNFTSSLKLSTKVKVNHASFNVSAINYLSSWPSNVYIKLGGIYTIFNQTGTFNNSSIVSGFEDKVNSILNSSCSCPLCQLQNNGLTCGIGLEMNSSTAGGVRLSDLNITQDIKNVTIIVNTNYTLIDLDDYFYDRNGDSLIFNSTTIKNISVMINSTSHIVKLIPQEGFYGVRYLKLIANDSMASTYSNNITITILGANASYKSFILPEGIYYKQPVSPPGYGIFPYHFNITFVDLSASAGTIVGCYINESNCYDPGLSGCTQIFVSKNITSQVFFTNTTIGYNLKSSDSINTTLGGTTDNWIPWRIDRCGIYTGALVPIIGNTTKWRIHVHPISWTTGDIANAVNSKSAANMYFQNTIKGDNRGDITFAVSMKVGATVETYCHDNIDNDGDGLKDCADPDCFGITYGCLPKQSFANASISYSPSGSHGTLALNIPSGDIASATTSATTFNTNVQYTMHNMPNGTMKIRFNRWGLSKTATIFVDGLPDIKQVNKYAPGNSASLGKMIYFLDKNGDPQAVDRLNQSDSYQNRVALRSYLSGGTEIDNLDTVINISFANPHAIDMSQGHILTLTFNYVEGSNVYEEKMNITVYFDDKTYNSGLGNRWNSSNEKENTIQVNGTTWKACNDTKNGDFNFLNCAGNEQYCFDQSSYDCYDPTCNMQRGPSAWNAYTGQWTTGLCGYYKENQTASMCFDGYNNDWATEDLTLGNQNSGLTLVDCRDIDCNKKINPANATQICHYNIELNCSDGFDNDMYNMKDCELQAGGLPRDAEYDCSGYCRNTLNKTVEKGVLCDNNIDDDWDLYYTTTGGELGYAYNTTGGGMDCAWVANHPDKDCNMTILSSGARCELGREFTCNDMFDNDYDNGQGQPSPGWTPSAYNAYFNKTYNLTYVSSADYNDYDCQKAAERPQKENLNASWCFDNIDNDLDAYYWSGATWILNSSTGKDCADPDCLGIINPANLNQICLGQEYNATSSFFRHLASPDKYCKNGLDDDADNSKGWPLGGIDCRDPDCNKQFNMCYACPKQENITWSSCANSIDDNYDMPVSLADCKDVSCLGQQGDYNSHICAATENNAYLCSDGFDNNANGLIDCADPACAGIGNCQATETSCNDDIDNNANGLVDCMDPSCYSNPSCTVETNMTGSYMPPATSSSVFGGVTVAWDSRVRKLSNYTVRFQKSSSYQYAALYIGSLTGQGLPVNTGLRAPKYNISGPSKTYFETTKYSESGSKGLIQLTDQTPGDIKSSLDLTLNIPTNATLSQKTFEYSHSIDGSTTTGNLIDVIILDNIPPAITKVITEPTNKNALEYGSSVNVIVKAVDPYNGAPYEGTVDRCYYNITGPNGYSVSSYDNVDCKFSFANIVDDGTYTLKVSARDDTGNVGQINTTSYIIDLKPKYDSGSFSLSRRFYSEAYKNISVTSSFHSDDASSIRNCTVFYRDSLGALNSSVINATSAGDIVTCSGNLKVSSVDQMYSIWAQINDLEGDKANSTKETFYVCNNVSSHGTGSNGELWTCRFRDMNNDGIIGVCAKPVASTIPDQSWTKDTSTQIDLNNYFTEGEGSTLTFTSTSVANIAISIVGGIATLTPSAGFIGTRTVTFTAFGQGGNVTSNIVNLEVTEPTGPGTTGCASDSECDDGNACTTDVCSGGSCFHNMLDCADADPCTVDSCVAGACQHNPKDCSDFNPCTTDSCVAGICQNKPISCASTQRLCDDGTIVSCSNSCSLSGCSHCTPKCPKTEKPVVIVPPVPPGVEGEMLYPFPCVNVTKRTTETPILFKTTTIGDIVIPEGYDILVNPFTADCSHESMDMAISIPDNYIDVKVLRCVGNYCVPMNISEINKLWCGEQSQYDMNKLYNKSEFFNPEMSGVKIEEKNVTLSGISNDVIIGKTQVVLSGASSSDVKVSVMAPDRLIPEPKNPVSKIIGSPLTIKLSVPMKGVSAKVTLPYTISPEYDESSLSLYVLHGEDWQFIDEVEIDNVNHVVTGNIKDISQYLDGNNEVQVAIIGHICEGCVKAELKKVYEPKDYKTRDAIILIHGLASSPRTFNKIISDIELTNQPFQVYAFTYPTSKKTDENSAALKELLEEHEGEFDNVYIVAHSLGGIIAQKSLHSAYDEMNKGTMNYKFLDKVKKVILIGVPNEGTPAVELYKQLFKSLVNDNTNLGFVNPNSPVLDEIVKGYIVPRVPGINYYVIAGTKPYEFNLLFFKISSKGFFQQNVVNDGLVAATSAQHVGDALINDKCKNYWELNVSHTDLINDPIAIRLVEKIISQDIKTTAAIIGRQKYLDFKISDCVTGERYIVIGKKIDEKAVKDEYGCSCGNGVCGEGEDETNCPQDCAKFMGIKNICSFAFIPILAILVLLTIISGLFTFSKYRRRKEYDLEWIAPVVTLEVIGLVISVPYMMNCKISYAMVSLLILMAIIAALPLLMKPKIKVGRGKLSLKEIDQLEKDEDLRLREIDESLREKDERLGKINNRMRKIVSYVKKPFVSIAGFVRKVFVRKKKQPERRISELKIEKEDKELKRIDEILRSKDKTLGISEATLESRESRLREIDEKLNSLSQRKKKLVKEIGILVEKKPSEDKTARLEKVRGEISGLDEMIAGLSRKKEEIKPKKKGILTKIIDRYRKRWMQIKRRDAERRKSRQELERKRREIRQKEEEHKRKQGILDQKKVEREEEQKRKQKIIEQKKIEEEQQRQQKLLERSKDIGLSDIDRKLSKEKDRLSQVDSSLEREKAVLKQPEKGAISALSRKIDSLMGSLRTNKKKPLPVEKKLMSEPRRKEARPELAPPQSIKKKKGMIQRFISRYRRRLEAIRKRDQERRREQEKIRQSKMIFNGVDRKYSNKISGRSSDIKKYDEMLKDADKALKAEENKRDLLDKKLEELDNSLRKKKK